MSYRVEFGAGAQAQFHTLPEPARDALIQCAVELADQPWDATVRPPGDDPRFQESLFGSAHGILTHGLTDRSDLIATVLAP